MVWMKTRIKLVLKKNRQIMHNFKNAQRDDGHLGMYKDCKCPTSETIECANQPRRTGVIQIKDMTRWHTMEVRK